MSSKTGLRFYYLHKESILEKMKEQRLLEPWKFILKYIKQRCNNKNRKDYKEYGGRGIKCLITEEELKELWFRDKAYLMTKPSIDREDNNGHYEFLNCSFIELSKNIAKGNKERHLKRIIK